MMKLRLMLGVLLLALAPAALASTTWYVNGVTGSDGNNCLSATTACKTIGHAISLASSGDSITVAAATYTENLTINIDLTINGAGAGSTIVDGGAAGPVVVVNDAVLTLSGSTIRNGLNRDGGPCSGQGGGICSTTGFGVAIVDCVISGNTAVAGGGVYVLGGDVVINKSTISGNSATEAGGIFSNGANFALNNSTVSGNTATSGPGGGLFWEGPASVTNSTISGNAAHVGTSGAPNAGQGGGIFNLKGGRMFLNNSTIAGNMANASGANGAGIAVASNFGLITIQNSIVANNQGDGNCLNSASFTSNGYNLSNDDTCHLTGPGDLNDMNPKLGPLQNNGGPTQTMALQSESPALDAGNFHGCTDGVGHLLTTDQRGAPRPDPGDANPNGCDIGAYESQN